MTDNTEEAVAWRAKNYQGEPWTVAPCEFSKRHYQRIEPLFPLSSLTRRDERIAELEGLLRCVEITDDGIALIIQGVGIYGWRTPPESAIGPVVAKAFSELARQALSSIKGEG